MLKFLKMKPLKKVNSDQIYQSPLIRQSNRRLLSLRLFKLKEKIPDINSSENRHGLNQ